MNIGRAIQLIREARSVRMNQLASEAAVSVPYLSLLESGQREASMPVLKRLADALDVPLDALLLLDQPGDGTLRSTNSRAKSIASAIQTLEDAEQKLLVRLQQAAT